MSQELRKYTAKRLLIAFLFVILSFAFIGLNHKYLHISDGLAFLLNILLGIVIPVVIVKTIEYPRNKFGLLQL